MVGVDGAVRDRRVDVAGDADRAEADRSDGRPDLDEHDGPVRREAEALPRRSTGRVTSGGLRPVGPRSLRRRAGVRHALGSLVGDQLSNRSAATGFRWRGEPEVGETGDQPEPRAAAQPPSTSARIASVLPVAW